MSEANAPDEWHFDARRQPVALLALPCLAIIVALLRVGHPTPRLSHAFVSSTGIATVYYTPPTFPSPPFVIFSTRVVWPDHNINPAYVAVGKNGTISAVRSSLTATLLRDRVLVDVSPLIVMPGLIDPHVHCNEPGRTSWEGFQSASKAAAAGGTTAILDMPLNNIPSTTSQESVALKVSALASMRPLIDVGLIGGVVPSNVANISELAASGVLALKSFMVDSQSVEFPNISAEDFQKVVKQLHSMDLRSSAETTRLPYILHAELDPNDRAESKGPHRKFDHERYSDYEASRPASWEVSAVRLALKLSNNSNVHIHIAHVAAVEVVQLIAEARDRGQLHSTKVTAETCPHYLLWATEEIPAGSSSLKCAPPIRSAHNRRAMLQSVFSNTTQDKGIDLIASDHSPCPPELKSLSGNLTESWGGIAGLQYRLQGSWTAATSTNSDITKIVELLAEGPAKAFGLDEFKGFLKVGYDADIVIWDPDRNQRLTAEQCFHRHKNSPFHGLTTRGTVFYTLLRGEAVFVRNSETGSVRGTNTDAQRGKGRLLVRNQADGRARAINPRNWEAKNLNGLST